MTLEEEITQAIIAAAKKLYGQEPDAAGIQLQATRKEFEGDLTYVVFPLLKISHKKPEDTANEIGAELKNMVPAITDFNVIKGFLNLCISKSNWVEVLNSIAADANYGCKQATDDSPLYMVEYSSPNTNKPLHLGHVRNNLLGHSLCQILKANGLRVVKTNIVNDRGSHICKSMLAWKLFGNGETPESTEKKGDHLVGDYYVRFDQEYRKQVKELMETKNLNEDDAKKQAPLILEAQKMLEKWEAADPEVRALWKKMKDWVYAGFGETYKRLGISFDKIYYESQTYLDGKAKVNEGLEKGIFYKRPDGSVWADLKDAGLDEKLLLRADGTSVYMTQDIGTAQQRFHDYNISKMIYVVGNEQNYHFQVLSILLDRLGFKWGKDLVHFSYGMVELPEGKMKSREGTVVDADDLMDEMIKTAKETSSDKLKDYAPAEVDNIARIRGLGALKYFILKIDPRKNMMFNPKESIDFNGNTGPFIQYTYARICSVLRKAAEAGIDIPAELNGSYEIAERESTLIQNLASYGQVVKQAGEDFSPALIANYAYELAKAYNQFYHDFSILKEENNEMKTFRLVLSREVAKIIKSAMNLLGIEVPERM